MTHEYSKKLVAPHQQAADEGSSKIWLRAEDLERPDFKRLVELELLLHQVKLLSRRDMLLVFRPGMQTFDDLESLLSPVLGQQPSRTVRDELGPSKYRKRWQDLQGKWEAPGETCGWRVGGKEVAGEAHPACPGVPVGVHDAGHGHHGSARLGCRDLSLVPVTMDFKVSCLVQNQQDQLMPALRRTLERRLPECQLRSQQSLVLQGLSIAIS